MADSSVLYIAKDRGMKGRSKQNSSCGKYYNKRKVDDGKAGRNSSEFTGVDREKFNRNGSKRKLSRRIEWNSQENNDVFTRTAVHVTVHLLAI